MRVLVVEDDTDACDALVEALVDAGHDARSCVNVPSARWVLAAFRPEAVLVDIGLPVFDGNELAAHIRAVYGAQPLVVAVTGLPPDRVRHDLFDVILTKPIGWDLVTKILDQGDPRH